MKRVVLAYSGGLDTSIILKWLQEKGYEVVAYIADVGQKDDFTAAKKKAMQLGASEVFVEDLKREFVDDYVFPAISGSARYEGRYLLGTSLARPIIAKRQIEIAEKMGALSVSHGATGKGNDQVRFELAYYALMPKVEVLAPWKSSEFLEQFAGRTDLIKYAEEKGIPLDVSPKSPFSMDANVMHISYEAGVLEDPKVSPPKDMFQMTVSPQEAPDKTTGLRIHFKSGIPTKVEPQEGNAIEGGLEILTYLNKLAGENGIGRVDIVENRYVGIKSRGVYETPGATVLWAAHQDLEVISLDREVLSAKHSLVPKFTELIYNGYWFSQEMEFVRNSVDCSQKQVTGYVDLELYKGNITVVGRHSESGLYNTELASMDVEGGYNQQDAGGFIKVNAVRLMASAGKKQD